MPSAVYVVPTVLLVAVLAVSALAKLRDPRDTSSVFRQLELPAFLLRLRAPRLLPYGELVLVAALLLTDAGWYLLATSVALLLFVAYFGVILHALRLPHPVTCPCFGRLGLGEVTRRTLVRNGVLVVLALVAWGDSWRGDGVTERVGRLAPLVAGVSALVVAAAGLTVAVVRRLQRSPVGDHEQSPAPTPADRP